MNSGDSAWMKAVQLPDRHTDLPAGTIRTVIKMFGGNCAGSRPTQFPLRVETKDKLRRYNWYH